MTNLKFLPDCSSCTVLQLNKYGYISEVGPQDKMGGCSVLLKRFRLFILVMPSKYLASVYDLNILEEPLKAQIKITAKYLQTFCALKKGGSFDS